LKKFKALVEFFKNNTEVYRRKLIFPPRADKINLLYHPLALAGLVTILLGWQVLPLLATVVSYQKGD